MNGGIYIGQVRGIKIFLHWSFLILMAWIMIVSLRRDGNIDHAMLTGGYILALFGCVVLHELGHALTARRFGIKTRDITLLPIGGVARMEKMPEKPREEFLVAIAGPAVNVVIFSVLWAVHYTLSIPIIATLGLQQMSATGLLTHLMLVNAIMAVFNLTPAFPMDGGRILRALLSLKLPRLRATQLAARIGQVFAIGFIILGIFTNFWLIFVGIFIFTGAGGEAAQEYVNSELSHYFVRDIVMTQYPTVEESEPLGKVINLSLRSQGKEFLVLDTAGRVRGVITPTEMLAGISGRNAEIPVRAVMRADFTVVSPDATVVDALRILTENNAQMLPVGTGDNIIGIIDMANISEFLQVRRAIAG